jgi:hypothetical protein
MSDTTPILALPVLVPGQAQPYVTHNGALRRLDMLAQTVVEAFDAETPPELPEAGRVYALGAVPTAAWAGHPLSLAAWIDETWLFVDLQPGWRACSRDSGTLRIWDGAAWGLPAADLDQVAGLGIRTDHDATNRLSVKAEATLLSHDGAGHQLKINKKTGTDTASLLYQSNWSGRAEMGLAGSDDWSLKVSPDGSAWTEALKINATTSVLAGTAVVASATDTTSGRVPTVGWMGLGSDGSPYINDHFNPFQMLGQRSPIGLALLRWPNGRGAFIGIDLGFHLCDYCLDVFKLQLVLGWIDLLGFGPEERLLEGGNQGLDPRILILLRADNCLQLGNVIGQFIRCGHARCHNKTRAE